MQQLQHRKTVKDGPTWQECVRDISYERKPELLSPPVHCKTWEWSLTIIDPSKLKRERERCREEIRQEEASNFKFVFGLYFDGRKYAT